MIRAFLFSISLLVACPFSETSASSDHPIHVSVTEIEYDEKDKALEIIMRVFMDDLELAMRKRLNDPALDIMNPVNRSLDEMMRDYLKEMFSISLDNKKQGHTYLGHERDGEAFVFYVEVPKIKKWSTIFVSNRVLMDLYDDQSNLVHVTSGGKIRSLRLTKNNYSGELTFQH